MLSAARRARLAEQAGAGQDIPAELARQVRVVEYTVPDRNPGGELIAVITTVTDPHDIAAVDLAEAYHQRWEEGLQQLPYRASGVQKSAGSSEGIYKAVRIALPAHFRSGAPEAPQRPG